MNYTHNLRYHCALWGHFQSYTLWRFCQNHALCELVLGQSYWAVLLLMKLRTCWISKLRDWSIRLCACCRTFKPLRSSSCDRKWDGVHYFFLFVFFFFCPMPLISLKISHYLQLDMSVMDEYCYQQTNMILSCYACKHWIFSWSVILLIEDLRVSSNHFEVTAIIGANGWKATEFCCVSSKAWSYTCECKKVQFPKDIDVYLPTTAH